MKATIVRKETLGNLISGVFFGKCGKNMLADMRKTDFMKKKTFSDEDTVCFLM